jgi:hypothetical protein
MSRTPAYFIPNRFCHQRLRLVGMGALSAIRVGWILLSIQRGGIGTLPDPHELPVL